MGVLFNPERAESSGLDISEQLRDFLKKTAPEVLEKKENPELEGKSLLAFLDRKLKVWKNLSTHNWVRCDTEIWRSFRSRLLQILKTEGIELDDQLKDALGQLDNYFQSPG
jgi:hypothetical protein